MKDLDILKAYKGKVLAEARESAINLQSSNDFINVMKYLHILSSSYEVDRSTDTISLAKKQGKEDMWLYFLNNLELNNELRGTIEYQFTNINVEQLMKGSKK